MNYLSDKEFIENINSKPDSLDFIETIRSEVDDFFDNYKDNPKHMSAWAHHYFCKDDGGLLIFDTNEPNKHVCSICGKAYENDELLNAVWHTMYRNLGATNAWKSAVVYRYSKDKKYLDNVVNMLNFYADNYMNFKLHNKEGLEFESIENAKWGCSRIMPQSLNEAILIIRLINALELVKADLAEDFIKKLEDNFFKIAFDEMKPQVDQVHNIRCWHNSAIGIMGLFLDNQGMIDFAFEGEYNIVRQLKEGVTEDDFWYEGSIHYNFFLLEGIVNLMLFCKLYGFDFKLGEGIVEKMLLKAYDYAFDNHQFPNPNDGWPNINLKTYSYIYAMASKVYGKDSRVYNVLSNIVLKENTRATIPLSRPYYYNNDISLEEFLFAQEVRDRNVRVERVNSYNYATSYCGMIKNDNVNVFVKYGHNGPSHAHPDKMNIEVMLNDKCLSRDLSNSGYGNPFCNEWHRVSSSHNTVVADGKSHSDISSGGVCRSFSDNSIEVECSNVYEGIDFKRSVVLNEKGFVDEFSVSSKQKHAYDYIFHVEGNLLNEVETEGAELGFNTDGYQHIKNVKKVIAEEDEIILRWEIDGLVVCSNISLDGKQMYLCKSPDNPVNNNRCTIIIRSVKKEAEFNISWEMEE